MSLRKFAPFIASLAMMTGALADENYTNINLGPTFFTFSGVEKDADITTEQKGLYCGVRAEAEYAQKDGVYCALVGVLAPGAQTAYHTFRTADVRKEIQTNMKFSTYLWQVEGRIGRHYKYGENASIVPFLAVGAYHVGSELRMKSVIADKESSSELKMDWGYVAAGASGSYPFSDMLDVGFGFKLIRHLYSTQEEILNGDSTESKLHARWGYEVMVPVKATLGKGSQWNVQAEPFLLKIDTTRAATVMGARVSVQRAF